jgi:hypothetical protein
MPARLRETIRACSKLGIAVEQPNSGSHWKARNALGTLYTIPAHNGERTEISDTYVRGLCRSLGIDYDEMRRLLGQ